jgi:uncharacterized membrane protein
VIGLITAQLLALLVVVYFTLQTVFKWHALDLGIYYEDSLRLMQGQMPYRDFALEYPPLALFAFILPRLAVLGRALDRGEYIWLFLVANAMFSTLITLILAQICARQPAWRSAGTVLIFYTMLVGVSSPLLPWRYDLFPALLTALALLCALRQQPAWAGIWLGLGVAAKLYPIVLMPIFGAYYLASKDRRALVRLALGSSGAVAICVMPFVIGAPGQLLSFLRYHELRGLQLESLPAGAIVLAHVLGKTAVRLDFNYGALHLVSPLATATLKWLPIAFIALYGLVLTCCLVRFREEWAAHRVVTSESLVAYIVVGLLAFIATNKVFSPQYMIWLLPFAPLLRARHAGALLAICAITIFLFPFDYEQLLAMQILPVLLLNLRNLLVVALLIWLILDRAPAQLHTSLAWPLQAARRRMVQQQQPH